MYIIISSILCLIIGVVIGRYLLGKIFKNLITKAKIESEKIIEKAKNKISQDVERKVNYEKERYSKLRMQVDSERRKMMNHQKNQISKLDREQLFIKQTKEKLEEEEKTLQQKHQQLQAKNQQIEKKETTIEKKEKELQENHHQYIEKMSKLLNEDPQNIRERLEEEIKKNLKSKSDAYLKQQLDEVKLTATKEAKKIIINTIQRVGVEFSIENSLSVVNIENDDIKGKIIGREGRNIRTFESLTGVELIVDDTPNAIIISCLNPVRKEIAKLSLQKLIMDGRIQPTKIEEIIKQTEKQIEEEIVEHGDRTVIELGITGLHPNLIQLVGKMRYRSSYGQNLLQHSREVSNLCATMAAELNLDIMKSKRAGLLHDIGKVIEDNTQPHAILGMEIAKKCGEHHEVCNAIGAHHDEIEMEALISPIIQICDAISSARPGVRKEAAGKYIERLQKLEDIGISYQGVVQCFAIQAGRELRVIVDAEKVSDEKVEELAFTISRRIEEEMQYPGYIKVSVVREKRSVSTAR